MPTNSQKTTRNVALAYPAAIPWMALFVQGVADYARKHANWKITTSPPTLSGADELALNIFSLRGWPGDGAIAAIANKDEARTAREIGMPVVNLSGSLEDAGVPRVMIDHFSIGRMAAEHLLDRGFHRLAFCGTEELYYSRRRAEGFAQYAEQAGVPCEIFDMQRIADPRTSWKRRIGPLSKWLSSLQRPVGLMAIHDYRARMIMDECDRLKLNVPHDIAVVGVDNDQTVCEYSHPTLSSVCRNSWRVGYESAALLDRLMSGESPDDTEILIQPEGIAARQSTDTVVIDDKHVSTAVHYMRGHLGEAFGIDQVVKHIPISRRQLEMRFRRSVGCSPKDYLLRLRVERAKELLQDSRRLKMHCVAVACGFSSAERLRLVFLRLTGQTPLEYRRSGRASQS
ncbi:MAG: substrate-binding domain-containing protein [Pirellulales bacterium]|nr:substrate-binding domain-containing protein [Pirellulales bacterium]